MRRRCATGAVGVVSVFVGLMPGREGQSPQERRLCAEIPCLAAGLGERAAVSRERERGSDSRSLLCLPESCAVSMHFRDFNGHFVIFKSCLKILRACRCLWKQQWLSCPFRPFTVYRFAASAFSRFGTTHVLLCPPSHFAILANTPFRKFSFLFRGPRYGRFS